MPVTSPVISAIDAKLTMVTSRLRVARASFNFEDVTAVWKTINRLLDERNEQA